MAGGGDASCFLLVNVKKKNNEKSLVERKKVCTFAPAKKCIALALRLTIP
jgi:hypothetical protein